MNEWRKVKLGNYLYIKGRIGWKGLKKSEYLSKSDYRIINAEAIFDGKINWSKTGYITKERYEESPEIMLQNDDILISKDGTIGKIGYIKNLEQKTTVASGIFVIRNNNFEILDTKFIYHFLSSKYFKNFIQTRIEGSVIPHLYQKDFIELEMPFPSLNIQKKISKFLSDIDERIELNNKINDNLEKLIFLIYQNIFSNNIIKKECKMNEYFDISIGKTPPRKNQEYFSNNSDNNLWVSILDMKSSGIYINKSSEYLTDEAIKKCNIKIIPKNTLLLSFKLTIGRIAITYLDKTTTNEAIAHFLTDKKGATEYLYCYLKKFNFNTLGSTSSIATAVNSKIIKEMPFIVPQEKDLENFYNLVKPLFENIKNNQIASEKLINLKNYLLPRLMNGEIDVEKIEL